MTRYLRLCAMATTVAFLITSCAATPNQSGLAESVQRVQESIKRSIDGLRGKSQGQDTREPDITNAIVNQYPLDQVPHTLMKKPVAEGILTSGHGYRFSPTGVPIPRKHKGIDYSAPTGTPIYAAGDGTIQKHYISDSYGKYISIEHKNGFVTAYAHMQAFADGLDVGSIVTKGQIIGNVGSTGRSSGPHLHFELRHSGKYLDPLFESTESVDSASN